MRFILASKSPRRKEILSEIITHFEVIPAVGEEKIDLALSPEQIVIKIARAKAEEVFARNPDAVVLGSDTIVYFKGRVLGKPKDEEDAFQTLSALSGNEHFVYTGVHICTYGREESFACCTRVLFNTLSETLIRSYIAGGSSLDKAGSYGIQDCPELVKSFEGSFTNIVGLPKDEVRDKLVLMGIING